MYPKANIQSSFSSSRCMMTNTCHQPRTTSQAHTAPNAVILTSFPLLTWLLTELANPIRYRKVNITIMKIRSNRHQLSASWPKSSQPPRPSRKTSLVKLGRCPSSTKSSSKSASSLTRVLITQSSKTQTRSSKLYKLNMLLPMNTHRKHAALLSPIHAVQHTRSYKSQPRSLRNWLRLPKSHNNKSSKWALNKSKINITLIFKSISLVEKQLTMITLFKSTTELSSTFIKSESTSMSQPPTISWSMNTRAKTTEGSLGYFHALIPIARKSSESGTTFSIIWESTPMRDHITALLKAVITHLLKRPTSTSILRSIKGLKGSLVSTVTAVFLLNLI